MLSIQIHADNPGNMASFEHTRTGYYWIEGNDEHGNQVVIYLRRNQVEAMAMDMAQAVEANRKWREPKPAVDPDPDGGVFDDLREPEPVGAVPQPGDDKADDLAF